MRNTYDTAMEAEADRAQQKELLVVLNASERALRRDECGAWCIRGEQGSIHTWGDSKTWVLYVACRSARHWTSTKRQLAFCEPTQDGDTEGCLRLHQLPTANQATLIRSALGIRKRAELSPDELERRRTLGKRLARAQEQARSRRGYPKAA